jgi:hypothetical protein
MAPVGLPPCLHCARKTHSQSPGDNGDIFFSDVRVTPMPNGLMPIFYVSNLSGSRTPRLTKQMLEKIATIRNEVRPKYRRYLAFTFEKYFNREFLIVFLDGHWQYPELECCYRLGSCKHNCGCQFNPVLHLREIVPVGVDGGRCTDNLPIWNDVAAAVGSCG